MTNSYVVEVISKAGKVIYSLPFETKELADRAVVIFSDKECTHTVSIREEQA